MPKKILFLVSSMNSGGAERTAANLANAWVDRGDAVTLVVTYSGRGECFYTLSKKVELVYLSEQAGRLGRGVRANWARFRALRRLIRQRNPDVTLSFLTNVNVAALLATRGLNCRVIVAEHIFPPLWPIGKMWDWLRRKTYPFADRVVMLTSEGLNWLHAHIPSAQGAVISNPVLFPLPVSEPQLPPANFVPAERRLLLAVGRLNAGQKQFDRLLEAFATLAPRYPQWDLIILGEGAERKALEEQVERLGLTRNTHLPGNAGNIGDWYSRADLYVMSSRFEGFPNTLVEAMAHGCAAVSYDCDTGPRDIIRHEQDGLLVSPVGDVPALALALDRLMGDDALRKRMATQALDVRDRYSMSSILAKWDALFEVSEKEGAVR